MQGKKKVEDSLRERLIVAGQSELREHGIKDFSLRRVALIAGVSCAAPYRHFKDKEELIREIVLGVREGWELLSLQIAAAYESDPAAALAETLVAGVKFWITGGGFRSVLLLGTGELGDRDGSVRFDAPLLSAIARYTEYRGMSADEARTAEYSLLSLFYGTVVMLAGGMLSAEDAPAVLRAAIKKELG